MTFFFSEGFKSGTLMKKDFIPNVLLCIVKMFSEHFFTEQFRAAAFLLICKKGSGRKFGFLKFHFFTYLAHVGDISITFIYHDLIRLA